MAVNFRLQTGDLIRGSLLLTGSAVIQAVAGFAAQLVLMRRLPPEAFGEFATVLAGCGLVQMVLSLRINVLIIRTPDERMTPDLQERFQSALCWETLVALIATLGWQAAAGLLSPLSCVLVASLAVGQWTNQSLAFYERSLPYRNIAAVEAGTQLAGHLMAVIMVLSGAGASALYVRELLINLLRLGAFSHRGAVRFGRVRWLGAREWGSLLRDSRDVWVDGVVESGFSRLAVLASGAVGGMAGAGYFSQAQRLALVPHQLLAPTVVRMAGNLFARTADKERRWRLLARMSTGVVAGLSLAAVVAILFSDPVVPWLFGAQWHSAARVLAGMAGMIVFFSTFELLRVFCISQRLTWIAVAARAAQYPLLGLSVLAARGAGEPVMTLAIGFSLIYATTTAIIAIGLLRVRGRESAPVPR